MRNSSPIGFFDSGYGGLTVLKEVQKAMPQFDYLYLGDNARAPYGTKDADVVYEYTLECVKTLFSKGCELVVLACNTASAKALRRIQQYDLINYPGKRVLGVVRPSAEIVGDFSTTNQIVVLGTEGTVASKTYIEEFAFLSPQTKVHQYACPKWVPLIESGKYNSEKGKTLIKRDLDIIVDSFTEADVILLGCTHYPILQSFIEDHIPKGIQVISQGELVAVSLKSYLDRHTWMTNKLTIGGSSLYLTTGDPVEFKTLASTLLGLEVNVEHIKIM
ncbi:MAG TPA: glutamate racemase [Brumimicrobium sp.]|nr:glutamate racemase [Brumimicrobium sp.]